ncbi:lytic transglycosylase domain-containing protein [Chitinophagaceae bacterium MMS25-I14]
MSLLTVCINSLQARPAITDTADHRIIMYRELIESKKNITQFIEYTLLQYGIPKALRNLAVIESGLDNNILSPAGAAGTWQITPGAAQELGLNISGPDERYDLYKSTHAAGNMISALYKKYHNWKLVVAAYNCGAGNLEKAIQKAGSIAYPAIEQYLPEETINHVRKFLAVCSIMNEAMLIGEDNIYKKETLSDHTQMQTGQVVITAAFRMEAIATLLQLSLSELTMLNPCLEEELAAKGTASLVLPLDKIPDFQMQQNAILNQSLTINH